MRQTEAKEHWHGLQMQGKSACVDFADHSTSHSMYRNAAPGEDVLKFSIKARLQVLPAKYSLSTWYPTMHEPFCLNHHDPERHLESTAHITNRSTACKNLYIACHDCTVDIVSEAVQKNPTFKRSNV